MACHLTCETVATISTSSRLAANGGGHASHVGLNGFTATLGHNLLVRVLVANPPGHIRISFALQLFDLFPAEPLLAYWVGGFEPVGGWETGPCNGR